MAEDLGGSQDAKASDDEPTPDLVGGKRRTILIAAVLIVAGIAAFLFWQYRGMTRGKDRAMRRASAAWGAFRRCLVGELAAGELPSARVRAIALGKAHQRPATTEPKAQSWPSRCGEYAQIVHEQLDAADVPNQSAERSLALSTYRLASALDTGKLTDDLDDIFAAAAKTHLPSATPTPVPPPPPALMPRFSRSGLTPLGTYLYRESEARNPDGVTQILFLRHVGRPLFQLCSVGETAACKLLPESLADYAANPILLEGSTPEAPVLELMEAGEASGLYDGAAGTRLWQNRRVTRGFGIVHGTVDQVAGGEGAPFVLVHAHGAQVSELPLALPAQPPWLYQYADWMLWASGAPELRLSARRLLAGDAPLGPVVDLGPLPGGEESPSNLFCRSPQLLAVVMKPRLPEIPSLILLGDQPVRVPLPGELPETWRMACRGAEVVITTSDVGRAERIHCDRKACDMAGASASGVPADTESVDLGGGGGKLALLWIDDHRTFLRTGTLAELDQAPDQLLLDDADHGGIDATVQLVDSAPTGARVLLYDHRSDATFVLAIDAAGTASPLPVTAAVK